MHSSMRMESQTKMHLARIGEMLFNDARPCFQHWQSCASCHPDARVDGQMNQAAQRGKSLFFSERVGCYKCHPEPLYTDLKMHDVNSKGDRDNRTEFDTPTLIECWRTAPYMHDGQYTTLKQVFRDGKHGKRGGDIESLSDQELSDLIEFVLSL